ncbi:MAG: Zinc transporter ZupT [Candidatus Hydrogenedentes bacterium ADurb.Bin179]|nr:MAG: Zinc transporter ZupT [Candidatus Hydrogenedentes bacterium ADurb.Bin179]
MNSLANANPILQALIATLFSALSTSLGAAPVFFLKEVKQDVLDALLGAAAGVMIAASFFSLIVPAIEISESLGYPPWLPPAIGFLLGGGSLLLIDKILPHLHPGLSSQNAEGVPTSWRRSTLLVLAITLHNFPEGLAVGVAFGATAAGIPGAGFAGAVTLTIGIMLQNFPEGTAVAMPLRGEGLSRSKSFLLGSLSGAVEPIAGVLGAALVVIALPILPFALAFAAGAMIFVVAEELIPESQRRGTDIPTIGLLGGFVLMMVLAIAFE